jgi:hypothetical protein
MDDARADLGDEVEEGIGSHSTNGRDAQSEDENWEQQNAAPNARHSDEGSNKQTHQNFNQQIHSSKSIIQPNSSAKQFVRELLGC